MNRFSTVAIVCVIGVFSEFGSARAQGVDVTEGTWTLLGRDLINWNGSLLKFTGQEPDGTLAGYFDWRSNSGNNYGRELFDGMLAPDLTFTLHGYQLAPHPELGGPRAIALADYTGRVTPDGRRIVDGTWITRGGTRGTWESVFVAPEPSAALLLAIGAGGMALRWRKRSRAV